jgi:hypothetical protein
MFSLFFYNTGYPVDMYALFFIYTVCLNPTKMKIHVTMILLKYFPDSIASLRITTEVWVVRSKVCNISVLKLM